MDSVPVRSDEDPAVLLRRPDRSAEDGAREMIVTELYRRGVISRGRAAELLGMSLETFLGYASELGIPYFDFTEDEWEAEMRTVREIGAALPPSATRAR